MELWWHADYQRIDVSVEVVPKIGMWRQIEPKQNKTHLSLFSDRKSYSLVNSSLPTPLKTYSSKYRPCIIKQIHIPEYDLAPCTGPPRLWPPAPHPYGVQKKICQLKRVVYDEWELVEIMVLVWSGFVTEMAEHGRMALLQTPLNQSCSLG